LKALLGLSFPAEGFLDVVKGTIEHIKEVKLNDSMVSLACIITLLLLMVSKHGEYIANKSSICSDSDFAIFECFSWTRKYKTSADHLQPDDPFWRKSYGSFLRQGV